jgi:hypothetical protein
MCANGASAQWGGCVPRGVAIVPIGQLHVERSADRMLGAK